MTQTPSRWSTRVGVLWSPAALKPFLPLRRAAAAVMASVGVGPFFLVGVLWPIVGTATPWLLLVSCLLSPYVRAIDIESWSLLTPGGLVGRVRQAFGGRAGCWAAAILLIERLMLTALAASVIGHYAAGLVPRGLAMARHRSLAVEDMASLVAILAVGLVWVRSRSGHTFRIESMARSVWGAVGVLCAVTAWGAIELLAHPERLAEDVSGALVHPQFVSLLPYAFAFALALPAMAGGEGLARIARELPPPRVPSMRLTSRLISVLMLVTTVGSAWLFVMLVPSGQHAAWLDAPLSGVARALNGRGWLVGTIGVLVPVAALLMALPAIQIALADTERDIRRLSADGLLPSALSSTHPRFGTLSRALDAAAIGAVALLLMSGARIDWLGRAYAFAVGLALLSKIAALIRLRQTHPDPAPTKAPVNLRFGTREIPLGLILIGLVVTTALGAMLASRDATSVTVLASAAVIGALLTMRHRTVSLTEPSDESELVELIPADDVGLERIAARPDNVLVPIRNPHGLDHVSVALHAAGLRDIVIMIVRLLGVDSDDETDGSAPRVVPTTAEQQLFSRAIGLAERQHRKVRLLVVPARDVFEAIAGTASRLASSAIYVGESVTLTSDEQAKRLGDAWDHVNREDSRSVRLAVCHRSGRTDTYQLGAHPPALTPADLDLIHRIWLDAVHNIGPHVHHRDIVRAALTTMEQQLTGPERERALEAVREQVRPADELAAAVRERDFSRLRDSVRNRPAADLADLLTTLSLEDQVIAFRVLPRKDAASVFEYLSHDAQAALLKAMAHEDVAALLNDMAPDDRTMFLEELPAAATRQLLSLLTPSERSVAVTLLGYPEESVGRLMTPQYVAVRESWSIREVLDFIRAHGQNSETLDVVYVVDDQEQLIDDIPIRAFLLAPLDQHVQDLMDRRFVALKATDDQKTAVSIFRQHDRSALPVTDTAGTLIGIVTIDDMLDVAEATATEDIQRIGGSEALNEPYLRIAFFRMIQKRAGWLAALFLGEMLTATAMTVYGPLIQKAVVLSFFIPLIISSGGNSGSQASTLVIRAMALGEVKLTDWWRVMRREIGAGLILGAILGSIGFLRITIWSQFGTTSVYGPHWLLVAITVAVALVGVVLWGTLSGSLLPLLLRRLGFDPATSSAPFVATLVDVTGLVIYFSVALVIMRTLL